MVSTGRGAAGAERPGTPVATSRRHGGPRTGRAGRAEAPPPDGRGTWGERAMAEGRTDPGGGVSDDPAAIRSRMADTREALARELNALKSRVFGSRVSARAESNERGTTVAKKKA